MRALPTVPSPRSSSAFEAFATNASLSPSLAQHLGGEVRVFPRFRPDAGRNRGGLDDRRRHHERQHCRVLADLDGWLSVAAVEDLFRRRDLRGLASAMHKEFQERAERGRRVLLRKPSISSGGGDASALTTLSARSCAPPPAERRPLPFFSGLLGPFD
jgi:hypothetical protein